MTPIAASAIEQLQAGFRGEIILPDDNGYDEARTIWNAMFDRRPAVIARCVGNSDVINAVNFARENNLLIAVKGGGHNSAGNSVCDDGMMIDLSLMRSVHVDSKNKTARVAGGALLGDVDHETQLHGMALSSGIVSHTGVGGLTLGGGMGWISRKFGLSIDNLRSVELVTADGRLVTANREENADLFWAVRGGGGNFGIATSFEFNCVAIGTEIYGGVIAKKFENTKDYMQFHRDYVRTLPDGMTVWMVVRHAPPLPFLPEDVHGKMIIVIPFVWIGDADEGERLISPIREHGESHGEHIGMIPWTAWQSMFDPLVEHGARNYWKSHHIKEMSDEFIDTIIKHANTMPTGECEIFIPHMEGAPSRVGEEDTAFAHRSTPFLLNIHTRWREKGDDDRCMAWARELHEDTSGFAHGVYVNFLSEEGADRVKDAYSPAVWNRLVEVKKKWDPDNLFRMNQNIKPTG